MAHLSLSPPLQALQSPAPARSSCTCSEGGHDAGHRGVECTGLQKFARDIEGLLVQGAEYSDAVIIVEGVSVPIHRCILAVRSPFFRAIFSKCASENRDIEEGKDLPPSAEKYRYDLNQLVASGRVGYKTFMVVLNHLYGGKLTGLKDACSVSCLDSVCPHKCCWPVVDTYLEILCAASVFNIPELKAFSQQHLVRILEKVQIEDVLRILLGAWTHGATQLLDLSIQILIQSNIQAVTLEKQLPLQLSRDILASRLKLGLPGADAHSTLHEKQCKRIYTALDSDDIELVQLLLKETKLTLDTAYALHYAAAYCDSKTITELLELGMADINCKDRRGFTVLHIAALRRDPEIIGSLLGKGANPLDVTPDMRTALQISKNLTRYIEPNSRAEPREDLLRDKICVEILEQADKVNPLSVFPAVGERELFMRLLYLENRGSLDYDIIRLKFIRRIDLPSDRKYLEFSRYNLAVAHFIISSLRVKQRACNYDQIFKSVVSSYAILENHLGKAPLVVCSGLLNAGHILACSARDNREFLQQLHWLHLIVALARLLFPREAKVVLGLSHVFGTREFTGFSIGGIRQSNMDLNEEPSNSLLSDSESVEPATCMDETLVQRVEALQRAVEVGQKFFPRCIAILNKFMDDGSFEHACIQDRRIPEVQVNKKQCVTQNAGIKDMFAEAFRADIAAMDQQKSGKSHMLLASAASSSSSSSCPGADSSKMNLHAKCS